MIDSKTLAEWRYAATEMHLPPTWEQALELIREAEQLRVRLTETQNKFAEWTVKHAPHCRPEKEWIDAESLDRAEKAERRAEEFRALLREVESAGCEVEGDNCPICAGPLETIWETPDSYASHVVKHASDCRLAAALKGAP